MDQMDLWTLEDYIHHKPTHFTIQKTKDSTGKVLDIQYNFDNFKKLFDFFKRRFGTITIPKNTLVFHSNQFFSKDLQVYEPVNTSMKIQDLRRYKSKNIRDSTRKTLPFSKTSPRVFANFTPAGNMYVAANMSVCESVYVTTEDLTFFQIPYVNIHGHLKDVFELTTSRIFKEYIETKNKEDKRIYCGFVLSTSVDKTSIIDPNATRFRAADGIHVHYPEILILDGFDKFIKIAHYDIWDIREELKTVENIRRVDVAGGNDYGIARVSIQDQKASHPLLFSRIQTIGRFGDYPLVAYYYVR
jgi:hypothetical protein